MSNALIETISVLRTNLGMSELETKVYIPVAIGGNMTVGSVAAVIDVKHDKVARALKRLMKKGLVARIEGLVPHYRAISPNMAVNNALTTVHQELEAFTQKLDDFSESQEKKAISAVDQILENQEEKTQQTKEALSQYEVQILQILQSHAQEVVDLANNTISNFSDNIESAITQLDLELEDDLGLRLQELQKEIEKSQRKIKTSLKKTGKALDKWLKTERVSSADALSKFGVKASDLIDNAKSAVNQALLESEDVLRETGEDVKKQLTTQSESASNDIIGVLNVVMNELADTLLKFNEELDEAVSGAENAFSEFYESIRDSSKEHSQLTKERIRSLSDILSSLNVIVEEWKGEVTKSINSSSQTLFTQLEQITTNDTRYTEMLKSTFSGYLEKVNEEITEDYDNLRLISTEIGSDIEEHFAEAKSEVLSLLQNQSQSTQEQFAESQEALQTSLMQSSDTTMKFVNKSLDNVSKEIGVILQGSATEFNSLTDTLSKKITSAHRKIVSTSKSKQKSLLTGLKRFTKDFETQIENKFDEVTTSFKATTDEHLKNANVLYNTLNNKLDKRLANSVETLSSHVKQAQLEIDNTIEDQTSRIDQHLQNVRDEFHVHLEDITRQFISMTQTLEATFNGLLSSQTVEAKDLISSIHTGFKSSLKSELVRLEEDSLKLQKEYSSEIGQRIDDISESATAMSDSLEEFTLVSRQDIADNISKTLDQVEKTIQTTKEALDKLEDGPIKQYQDSLLQTSKDYSTSINDVESSISENYINIREIITTSINNQAENIRKSLNSFSSENTDTQQRLLADTSKKLDVLSTKIAKASMNRLESYKTSLTDSITEHSNARTKMNDELQLLVEERRSEASLAFGAASVWIESAVANLEESLVAVGGSLENGIITIKDDVDKASEDIAGSLVRKSKDRLAKLTTTGAELLEKAESALRTYSADFDKSCQKLLNQGKRDLSEIPTTLGSIVDETITNAVSEANLKHHDVVSQLGDAITDYEVAVSSVVNEYSNFLENSSKKIMKERDVAFEQANENVLLANQHASRKFEQVGLDFKTQLSNITHSLIETIRSDVVEKNSETTDKASKISTTANEETSKIKQARNEFLNKLTENTDKTLRRWAADRNKQTESIVESIDVTMNDARHIADKTIEALEALDVASSKISIIPTDNTWYVTGREEIYGYLMDMAQRAENSILLSIPEIECIDIKKLTRIKQARRKVLILPRSENPEPLLKKLKGWRIWQTETPMLLAVIDKEEIAIGGQNLTDTPVVIISLDENYLQLYHDVLGPAIIEARS